MNIKKLILGLTLSMFAVTSSNCMEQNINQINTNANQTNQDKTIEISEKTLEDTIDSLNFLIEELKVAKQAVNNSKTNKEKAVNQSIFLSILRRTTNSFLFLVNMADKISSKKFIIGLIITIGPIVSIYGKYINADFFPQMLQLLGKRIGEGASEIAINTSAGLLKGALIGTYKNIWAIVKFGYNSISMLEKKSFVIN